MPKPKTGNCLWCVEPATATVVISEGREAVRRGKKVWMSEQTAPACEVHAHQYKLRGKGVRSV